jgi:hypothetical protein
VTNRTPSHIIDMRTNRCVHQFPIPRVTVPL